MLLFFVKHFTIYGPVFGTSGAFWLYMFVRMLESHWFVWVTQMSHIVKEVDRDQHKDWVHLQVQPLTFLSPLSPSRLCHLS